MATLTLIPAYLPTSIKFLDNIISLVHQGIKLSRVYPYTPPGSGRSKQQFTDYYFWSLEEFSKKLSFICEGKQEDIGCVEVHTDLLKYFYPELGVIVKKYGAHQIHV